jgi:hypothetical protein
MLTPTTFAANHTITINALKCEPKFQNPTGNIPRLGVPTSPNKVQVYLPSSMSAIDSELDAAISAWNGQIGATGIQYEKVTADCGAGPYCIKIETASLGTGCGFSAWDPPPPSGILSGGLKLQLHNDYWTWSSAGRARTLVHELGHFVGLDDYSPAPACAVSDAMMQPDFACGYGSTPASTLTISDYLPAVNTVYNGKSKKSCGF